LPDELYQRVKDIIPDQPITTYVEKGVDTSLAVDMAMLAYRNMYDVAILVSGVTGILCLWLREFRILVKR
jgi:uncharacterized LabA/DUF88 family protein